ncbi:MAG: TetR/AcrR family transcriptional regulator [Anaerolineaceae bacterium]|jgi:TetR/AcrR family transcriptional regulator
MPLETFFNLPDAKRTLVEEAAIDEFAAKPYQCASISAIVARAKIAKGSFYQYFSDKKDLYRHVLRLVQQRKKELVSSLTVPSISLDTFAYLRWMIQLAVLFEMRHPKLAHIERLAFLEQPLPTDDDPENGYTPGSTNQFKDFLIQGILHDDLATWVDTDMAACMISAIYHQLPPYLIERMGEKARSIADGSVDIAYDPLTQDLFDNCMDLLEAGMARDPQIRKDFFSK